MTENRIFTSFMQINDLHKKHNCFKRIEISTFLLVYKNIKEPLTHQNFRSLHLELIQQNAHFTRNVNRLPTHIPEIHVHDIETTDEVR